jgi:hypothetical protein
MNVTSSIEDHALNANMLEYGRNAHTNANMLEYGIQTNIRYITIVILSLPIESTFGMT